MAFEIGRSPKRSLEQDGGQSPMTASKRCRYVPLSAVATAAVRQNKEMQSPFANIVPRITSDQIVARLSAETKHQQQCRQHGLLSLASHSSSTVVLSPQSSSLSSTSSMDVQTLQVSLHTTAPHHRDATSQHPRDGTSASHQDVPLLTLKQVGLVCERLLNEREQQVRAEYDRALANRLSEQYEAFLMFNHDQLHRRTGEVAASYVS